MIRIGNKRIVLKPASLVLLTCIPIAIIAPFQFHRGFAQPNLDWDCVNPTTWKFELQPGATAEIVTAHPEFEALKKASETAAYHIDTTAGVTVNVTKTKGVPDSVYLRNGLNFDSLKHEKDLALQFSARTDNPHDLIFVLREGKKQQWSARVLIQKSPTVYSLPLSFSNCAGSEAVLAIHLGIATGAVTLKDIRIVSRAQTP